MLHETLQKRVKEILTEVKEAYPDIDLGKSEVTIVKPYDNDECITVSFEEVEDNKVDMNVTVGGFTVVLPASEETTGIYD